MDDREASATPSAPASPGTSSSSGSPSSPAWAGLAHTALGLTAAAGASWLLHLDHEVPWNYRYYAWIGIWSATLLPLPVFERLATAVLSRFLPGGKS